MSGNDGYLADRERERARITSNARNSIEIVGIERIFLTSGKRNGNRSRAGIGPANSISLEDFAAIGAM